MPATARSLTRNDLNQRTAQVLRVVFGGLASPAKQLAAKAGASERTAVNWLDGKSSPDFLYALRLMETVPEFAAEVRRLTAMVGDIDPEFQRDFLKAVSAFQKMRDGE